MPGRRLAATLLVAASLAGSGAALAVRAREPAGPSSARRRAAAPPFEASPASGLRVRDHAAIGWRPAPAAAAAAWARFRGETGDDWIASWDEATQVPSRLFGRGVPAPRAVADAAAAAEFARGFLARHIDLLAPGADPADFVLVSNVEHRGMRVVGFRQTAGGMTVIGGQVSFRFKNDRLFVIGSEALPHVTASLPRAAPRGAPTTAAAEQARAGARGWVLRDAAAEATAGEVSGPFVLPLVGDAGVLGYRVVHRVDVAARAPIGRFWVYTDAASGAPVAREQRLRFADGVVEFNVPVRYPAAGRQAYPARRGIFIVDGSFATSDEDGRVTWSGGGPVELEARTTGPLVVVTNRDQGNRPATRTFSLDPGGTVVWDESGDELRDSQLTGFIHARVVKEYARTIAPDLAWLDQVLPVNVNIADQCNAFSDGQSINFFQSSPQCANTGTLADVIYHEFGHTLHAHSIIDGVGSFDGAHSEGLSDFLAASLTGDHGMGRGFFRNGDPLRDIDPPDYENSWPRDVGEIHFTGLIFAGAMWDLRKLLVTQLGEEDGVALANHLYYGTLQRATNIPSTYAEVLAEDDDDGDLSNGTPHDCDINTAFGAHGLRALTPEVAPLSAESITADGFPVSLRVNGFSPACPGDGVAAARLTWRLRDQSADQAHTIDMSEDDGAWIATIPPADPGQVVRYSIAVDLLDGAALSFPDNMGDPEYEFYAGPVEDLYCTDFETDPFGEGWTHGVVSGVLGDASDDWQWGEPLAPPAAGDPPAAFSGANLVGTDLGGDELDGLYQPNVHTFVQSPVLDVGNFSDVRLHYWRWLTVEDGFFDHASILANDRLAWTNFDSDQGNQSSTHSLDREWRFQDVPVGDFIEGGKLQVKFDIESDGGLQFGGWNIDDFCVVATPGVVCGDGEVTGGETCDEGPANSDSEPDACRTSCRVATCGDGVVDSGEVCDDGNLDDGDACSADCAHGDDRAGDCGCDATPRAPMPGGGPLLIVLGAALLLGPRAARRLRRRRARD